MTQISINSRLGAYVFRRACWRNSSPQSRPMEPGLAQSFCGGGITALRLQSGISASMTDCSEEGIQDRMLEQLEQEQLEDGYWEQHWAEAVKHSDERERRESEALRRAHLRRKARQGRMP